MPDSVREGQTALANQSQICIVNAMITCPLNAGEYPSTRKSWRNDAARIVEDLFRCTPADTWNMLLDLREHLLDGDDWNETLDLFLSCRERLESEQYLPFYRLRRLLAESLRLEAGRNQAHVASLREVLRRKHRSLADIKRTVTREIFEHDLGVAGDPIQLCVVECKAQ
jgi:hypothetical protein